MTAPTKLGTGFTTKPRWDKYDGYVGNFRAPLAADVVLATQANKVLPVGLDSNGAAVLGGAGQTGVIGIAIVPVGTDMAGHLLDGGVNTEAGDIVDVGKHGEIVNFKPSPTPGVFTVTVVAVTGNYTVKVNGTATGDVAYDANAATLKAALVAVDDSFVAADFTVTGTAPDFVVATNTAKSIVLTEADDTKATVDTASTTAAAGTKYYAHADGSIDSTSTSGVYIGHTVEADRLIVNVVEV